MAVYAITSFPTPWAQALSALVHFLGVSILAHCVSRRVASEHLTSVHGLAQISWARLIIIVVFIDSWLFLSTSGVIVFGVGLEIDRSVCTSAIYLCIVFYGTSKALIYAFLIEKVHIVWAPIAGSRRSRSPVYLTCATMMAGYGIIIILLFIGRVASIREDSICIIGLKKIASIPLLSYDLWINLLLTALFLWPLARTGVSNPFLRRVALRTLAASLIALTTSAVNILILTLMHGHQLGWLCLGSCGLDVVINALVLFWVTSGSTGASPPPSLPHPHPHPPASVMSAASGDERSRISGTLKMRGVVRLKPATGGSGESQGHTYPPHQTVSFALAPATATAAAEEARPLRRARGSGSGGWAGLVRLLGREAEREKEKEVGLQITITKEFETDADDLESALGHEGVETVQKEESGGTEEEEAEGKRRSLQDAAGR